MARTAVRADRRGRGSIPPPPAQTVEIIDVENPQVLATATTAADGSTQTMLDEVPDENHTVKARWVEAAVEGDPSLLRVRPLLSAKLSRPNCSTP